MSKTSNYHPPINELRRQLMDRLARLRRKLRAHMTVQGAAYVAAVAFAMGLGSLVLDRWLRLSVPLRVALVCLGLAALGYVVWRWVIAPIRCRLRPLGLAAALDQAHHGAVGTSAAAAANSPIAPKVATVLQLPLLLEGPSPPSRAMVEQAVWRCHNSLHNVDFMAQINRRRAHVSMALMASLIAVTVLWAAVDTASAQLWFKRWFLASNQKWPQQTYLEVLGLDNGRIVVPRAEPYVLRVRARDDSMVPQSVTVRFVPVDGGKSTTSALTRFGVNDFRFDFPSVRAPIQVELWGGDDRLEPFTLEPVDRPQVIRLELASQHPTQPQPTTHLFEAYDTDLAFLPQTQLTLTITASVPIASVAVQSSAPDPPSFNPPDGTYVRASWTHQRPVQMQIELVSEQTGLESRLVPISIGLKKDRTPRLSIRFTGVRPRITPQAQIPLNLLARDDYGIAKLSLAIRTEPPVVDEQHPVKQNTLDLLGPLDPADQRQIDYEHVLKVADLALTPGSLLHATGQATDACYQGAQMGKSRTLPFRIVERGELLREILMRLQSLRAKFRQSTRTAKDLAGDLAAVAFTDDAAVMLRRHRLLKRQVWRTWRGLGDSVTEMRLNALGSPQANRLLQTTVVEPLKTLHDELMTQQTQALDQLGRVQSPDLVNSATNRQKLIVTAMNQILKKMAQWDSFMDVITQLDEIIKLQDNVNKSTEKAKEQEVDDIFDD